MRTRSLFTLLSVLSVIGLVAAPRAAAQSVGSADILRASVTVDKIDPATRTITYRDESGRKDTIQAPAEVKRFDEIKVGDKLNLTYTLARFYELRKASAEPAAATATGTSGTAAATSGTTVTRGDGPLPSGSVTNRLTKTVTVISTDATSGRLAVRTPTGRTVHGKLDDPSSLKGIVADDKIEITYTESLVAEIERQ